jgi:hypothetical protein
MMMNVTKSFLPILLNTMAINSFADDIQHFTSVLISGTAHHKSDINNTAYIELEIEKIALAEQETNNSKVWHTDSNDPRPQSIFVDKKKILHISNAKNALLSIHDTHGRKLQTLYPDSDNYETDISLLPPGLYIMGSMNIHIKFLIK